ncbi:TetR/AcrR family transcriptional regulator [Paenibacillus sp. MSJ-34]|uniref:TetR/AcrR family transcriptional regulator n=1 Tax=Paenibacillus sp. MSJ-34 TaxID=2841529 RepID=UPI001C120ADA|nr:TetR/AcrR family transcriptional regulator [Paenibacillus sp. MSJ-34]MBU5442144.1 TetR/AcrR family transcriptional regulator [Paenibacillus sp. MSJ-34]
MQVLKDEIRNKIRLAALKEFKKEGYTKTSMQKIAVTAGVAIGNIYRYYKNKDELFDELVQPVYERYEANMAEMRHKLNLSYVKDTHDVMKHFSNIEATLIELFKTFTAEMSIIFIRSEGTKYSHVKTDLIELAFSVVESMILKARRSETLTEYEAAVAKMFSSSLIEGMCLILRDSEEGDSFNKLMDQLLGMYSNGLHSIIKNMESEYGER